MAGLRECIIDWLNFAARLSPDRLALSGACAAIGGGVTYCGDRYRSHDFAPDVFSRGHSRRRHRM
jgi:hypothetical protein